MSILPRTRERPATYADIEALPSHVVGEILDGELFVSPRPAPPHAIAGSVMGFELGGPFQRGRGGPGGWWILDEPELHFDANVLVPDLAGWRVSRMPSPPETAYFTVAPDWVCEVLSPSTTLMDRARKLPIYARAGVAWVWLVDPIAKMLEVLRLDAGRWVVEAVAGEDEKVRAAPFDAIELELSALWSPPAPARE